MAKVKAKTTMKRTPLPNQRMASTKKPTIKSSNSESIANPQKFKMSAATREIMSISKDNVISRRKTQVKKDANKRFKSNDTVESLGRKPRRGRDTPWIELPEPEDLLYQDENSVKVYAYYRNYYAPLQELKKTKNMTWKAIHAIYAEQFPDRTFPKSKNVISAGASSYYHRLCVIMDAENEAIALAEATQNPEFVFPDDDDDDDESALDG
ncbi:hypothetical protein BGAL_0076g00310 [Botrytis galanthina]|uniref:Uncharacterized protein n=1 Tax=Botrytis galanthina TaxID=278940 RepID=A0A4V4HVA4_9HELO|nr:hypothetical protein BGAL_0076g00310 [Botrytis galanthina]